VIIKGGMMKRIFALLFFVVGFCVIYPQTEEPKIYDSIWEGKLAVNPAVSLRLIVKIIKNQDGTMSGFLDSPDQGVKDIPATKIAATSDSLLFEVGSIEVFYAGKIMKDSMVAVGKFKQGMLDVELKLKKVKEIKEARRPQLPVKPYPYNEEELTFQNNSAGINLSGTLTFPRGNGKYPAVVLVTGSGGQDRDETLFNHKPFLIIADYLTRNGIAVLRYDDRGIGKSTGNYNTATTEDLSTDVLAAVQYLKTRSEIDLKHIGIIGHSEGGIIASMASANSNDVAFIVLLAGPGVIGKELLLKQAELILKSNGTTQDEIDKRIKEAKEAYDIINSSPDSLIAYKNLEEMYDSTISKLSDEEKNKPENSKEVFKQQVSVLLSPWFRFFLRYDPQPLLESITVPVLALNGDKDLQVAPEQNLIKIEQALKSGGNKNFKTVKLPGLNHLFQTTKTGSLLEYGEIEETFSPDALKIIGDWIKEITK
jgi:uncharacterized protein